MSHYYEEGNVQMHNVKDFEATAVDTSESSEADAIAAHIAKVMTTIQSRMCTPNYASYYRVESNVTDALVC